MYCSCAIHLFLEKSLIIDLNTLASGIVEPKIQQFASVFM